MSEPEQVKKKRPGRKPVLRSPEEEATRKEAAKKRYYAPKPVNALFVRRLQAALDQKGWGRADLARELVKRGVLKPSEKDPTGTEPSSRGRMHYWMTGKVRPRREIQQAICDIFDKPLAYFTDPDWTDQVAELVVARLTEIIMRLTRTGAGAVEHVEQVVGVPNLLNTHQRRLFTAKELELIRVVKEMAPRPWAEMTATEQREYVEEMLRQSPD